MYENSYDATSNVPHNQNECRLFSLPPEIRNYIYEFVLTVEPQDLEAYGLPRVHLTPYPSSRRKAEPSVLALLQTCRRILHEAEGIFYASNNLTCGTYKTNGLLENCSVPDFLSTISAKRCLAIQSFTIHVLNDEQAQGLASMSNLRRLYIRPLLWPTDWPALRLRRRIENFEGVVHGLVRQVRKLRELETVKVLLPHVYQDDAQDPQITRPVRKMLLRMDKLFQEVFQRQGRVLA